MGRIMAGLIVALLCAAPLVMAQPKITADVPFPFIVRDMTCSPGEYSFVRMGMTGDGMMAVRNSSTGESVVFLILFDPWNAKATQAHLVFYRYGDRHFLREVHEGTGAAVKLLPGAEERRLQVAGLKAARTTVLARLR